MKLEHGKRYITRCGMITPILNKRSFGSFEILDDFQGGSTVLMWNSEGKFLPHYEGNDRGTALDLDIVAEATDIVFLQPQQYKNCQIDRGDHGVWNWVHNDYDGAPDAFGTDCYGNDVPDRRNGRCASVEECMAEIDELYEGAEK